METTRPEKFPIRSLIFGVLLTVLIVGGLAQFSHTLLEDSQRTKRLVQESTVLVERIRYLDEVLTMSANMAVMSGESAWKARYDEASDNYDVAFSKIRKNAPAELVEQLMITFAYDDLSSMESAAFKLVEQKQSQRARDLLASDAYAMSKCTYQAGIDQFFADFRRYLNAIEEEQNQALFRADLIGLAGLVLVLLSWIIMSKTLVRYHRINKTFQEGLEEQVRSRTMELQESMDRIKLLLESVGEGIWGVDLDGKITFANPQASTLLGCSSEQMIGVHAHDQFHDRHVNGTPYPVTACWWHKSLSEGGVYHIEDEVLWRQDGTCLDVEYRSTPVYRGGALVGAVVSFSDISERKRVQQERDKAMDVISGSIQYASRIQRSVLPDISLMERTFSDYLVHWDPRDLVGGDMYWCDQWGEGILLILGDCTGHGVPGAFMTLIVVGALGQAKGDVSEGDIAALILRMHQLIQITLGQDSETGESDDGIELGICYIPLDRKQMLYTGARFDLFMVENGVVTEIKGNKKGIGYRGVSKMQMYDTHTVPLLSTAAYYMTTDGLIDQIGGTCRRAFGKNRFKELLLSMRELSMAEQKERIRQALLAYQGGENRRDDVSIIGFKIGDVSCDSSGVA
ncbi:MAG: PAS domain S-box protein [Magnetococcus sp. YQC-5]